MMILDCGITFLKRNVASKVYLSLVRSPTTTALVFSVLFFRAQQVRLLIYLLNFIFSLNHYVDGSTDSLFGAWNLRMPSLIRVAKQYFDWSIAIARESQSSKVVFRVFRTNTMEKEDLVYTASSGVGH
jgi:hypothetical protein